MCMDFVVKFGPLGSLLSMIIMRPEMNSVQKRCCQAWPTTLRNTATSVQATLLAVDCRTVRRYRKYSLHEFTS